MMLRELREEVVSLEALDHMLPRLAPRQPEQSVAFGRRLLGDIAIGKRPRPEAWEQDEARDHVLQLADVARPVVSVQHPERSGRQIGDLARRLLLSEEVLRQDLDVFPPLTKRRNAHLDRREPKVEVAPEL